MLPFGRLYDLLLTDRIKTTHAHQLAMSVLSYSPMQWMFWYDKPSDYAGEPEIEFFERCAGGVGRHEGSPR
jgi:hypothetical protein